MAKIKTISGYQKQGAAQTLVPMDMETVEEVLQTHSVRLPQKWLEIIETLASSLSVIRGRKIRGSDIIREAVFQYCIKNATKDDRKTVLRSSQNFKEQEEAGHA